MSPLIFIISVAALSIGTFAMRFAGVKVGGALAMRARTRSEPGGDHQEPSADGSTTAVTEWMDRATVVLIAAVCATTAVFDGRDLADPARLIGVGVGVLAAIVRVPMLICVFLGMGVCAVLRMSGAF